MKQVIFLTALSGLILFSCSKATDNVDPASATLKTSSALEGSWRMAMVTDNNSGITTTKPTDIQGNVDITFTAINDTSGTFTGNTPTNDLSQNNYTTGINQLLKIPALGMTKVAETSWGKNFVDNIRSSEKYSFESNDKLVITTIEKTLFFDRK